MVNRAALVEETLCGPDPELRLADRHLSAVQPPLSFALGQSTKHPILMPSQQKVPTTALGNTLDPSCREL